MKEIYFNRSNLADLQIYLDKLDLDTHQIWVPFLVINNENECSYINGSQAIIDFFQAKLDMIVALEDENVVCNTETCTWLSCENHTLSSVSPVIQNILEDVGSIRTGDVSPVTGQDNILSSSKKANKWWFFAIMMPAAISDSINPCAFAVMLLLLTTILSRHKSRKKTLLAGWLFALAVFISYLAMGLGIFSALASSSNTFVLKLVVWILGVLVWLANIKDFFRYGKWFVMEVPISWRPKMQDIIHGVSSPLWAFVVWLIVSVFLLPCSSWPYFTILWFLSSQSKELHSRWFFYLIVYNLIFILPMLLIAILVGFEWTSVDKIAKLKHENTKLIHLIVGLLMLGLWIYVLVTM
jgi:cytochrome c biogenesis protein CcdA